VKPMIAMVRQRHDNDCGVACLAMYLGISYEDALIAFGGEAPEVLRSGVFWSQLKRAAANHGIKMVLRRKWEPTDEGILQVRYRKDHHVVVLRHGLIFDTDYRVWPVRDFYATPPKAPFGPLLVREE
jgi:predicted double-glycine peptidase